MEKVYRGSSYTTISQKTVTKIKIMVQSKTERDLTILLRFIKSNFNKQSFRRSDVVEFMEENNIPNPIYSNLMNFGPFEKVAPRVYSATYNFKKNEIASIAEFVTSHIAQEAKNRHAMKRAGDDGHGERSEDDKSLYEIANQDDIAAAITLLQDNGFTVSIVL
jgi:hypothetical protein